MDTYRITVGRSRTAATWSCKNVSWGDLRERLSRVKRTRETCSEYVSMTKAAKGAAKDVGGFVGGAFVGTQRRAIDLVSRSLVTLDIDYGSTTTPEEVRKSLEGSTWCLYSTHSSTEKAPRYRLVLPLSREVTADEYVPIARRIAETVGINLFDSSTYEPSRLMYWPSVPSDADYVFRQGEGSPIDADIQLATYTDWRNPIEWPIDRRTSKLVQGHGSRQEDPTLKPGLIGAFCRAYPITEAIATFLSDVYSPTDQPDRYTYIEGSTAGGLVVYQDKWAYSHHGTDPCCERLCNAFDLVRIHLFAFEDDGCGEEQPGKLPSFKSMESFAAKDVKVVGLLAVERKKELESEFGEIETTKQTANNGANGADPDDWIRMMHMDERRRTYLADPYNFGLIVRNDPRLKECVMRDEFRGRDVLALDLPWRKRGPEEDYWVNSDDNGLIEYVSKTYRLANKTALLDANDLAASQLRFHPVRDYLESLQWDGVPRLDTLLVDYLGARDTELTRLMTRKHLAAAVARVMRPGVKYDYVLTLIGPEGIGKSTLIRILAGEWFDDSLTSIEGKDGMEQVRGKWLIEFGELTNYKRSTSEAYKAFISKQSDSYRPAYGRKTETYPRQCVFFATTNEAAFLKGDTGNRRFWPVHCDADLHAKDVWTDLVGERDQIWAEAMSVYRSGETLYLPPVLERQARLAQNACNELSADDRMGVIEDYVLRRLPFDWDTYSMQQRRDFFRLSKPVADGEAYKERETISAVEVLSECFGQQLDDKTRYRTKEINQLMSGISCLEPAGAARLKLYGTQRIYRVIRLPEPIKPVKKEEDNSDEIGLKPIDDDEVWEQEDSNSDEERIGEDLGSASGARSGTKGRNGLEIHESVPQGHTGPHSPAERRKDCVRGDEEHGGTADPPPDACDESVGVDGLRVPGYRQYGGADGISKSDRR